MLKSLLSPISSASASTSAFLPSASTSVVGVAEDGGHVEDLVVGGVFGAALAEHVLDDRVELQDAELLCMCMGMGMGLMLRLPLALAWVCPL